MEVAIDLGKYHISDNHVQLSETSVRRLGRVGLVSVIINETFPEYYFVSFTRVHLCRPGSGHEQKAALCVWLTVNMFCVCETEHKVFLKS